MINYEEELQFDKFMAKVFKYVVVRKKTMHEVYEKFKNEENAEKFLDRAIMDAKSLGYLDDKKYAKLFVEDCINLKRLSIFEIKLKLKQKRISQKYIDEAIYEYSEELDQMEIKNVMNILRQKSNKEQIKVVRYIYQKGYRSSNVKIAIDEYNYEMEDYE